MAARKPKIGGPLGDDFVKMLEKALRGGLKKVRQQQRVVSKLEQRGSIDKKTGEYIMKSRYPKTGPGSKYRRDFPEESALYTNIQKKNAAAKKAAAKKSAYTRQQEAAAAKKAKDAKIIKEQERTLRADRLGEAASTKGTKRKGNKEIPMSRKQAEAAALQGKRAAAQRKKGNAAKKSWQINQKKKIDNAKSAQERVRLRRELRNHQDKYGRFD